MMEKRRAVAVVRLDVLAEVMHLPEGTEILSVQGGQPGLPEICGFVVKHSEFETVEEGETPPLLQPSWGWNWDGMEFDGWNGSSKESRLAPIGGNARMTAADMERAFTHQRAEPDTLPPAERPKV